MNFEEVNSSFSELTRLQQAGLLSNEEFRTELDKMRVGGPDGKVWKKASTGKWVFQSDGQWIPVDWDPAKPREAAESPTAPVAPISPQAKETPSGGMAAFFYVLSFLIPIAALFIFLVYRKKGEEAAKIGIYSLISGGVGLIFWWMLF